MQEIRNATTAFRYSAAKHGGGHARLRNAVLRLTEVDLFPTDDVAARFIAGLNEGDPVAERFVAGRTGGSSAPAKPAISSRRRSASASTTCGKHPTRCERCSRSSSRSL